MSPYDPVLMHPIEIKLRNMVNVFLVLTIGHLFLYVGSLEKENDDCNMDFETCTRVWTGMVQVPNSEGLSSLDLLFYTGHSMIVCMGMMVFCCISILVWNIIYTSSRKKYDFCVQKFLIAIKLKEPVYRDRSKKIDYMYSRTPYFKKMLPIYIKWTKRFDGFQKESEKIDDQIKGDSEIC